MEAKDRCDITISIDCDGQDDLNAMDEMVDKYLAGAEVVYGVRSQRKTDTWFKRTTAQMFYRLMNMMGAEVVYNHRRTRFIMKETCAWRGRAITPCGRCWRWLSTGLPAFP